MCPYVSSDFPRWREVVVFANESTSISPRQAPVRPVRGGRLDRRHGRGECPGIDQRGNSVKGFTDFNLKAESRPESGLNQNLTCKTVLSYMCHLRHVRGGGLQTGRHGRGEHPGARSCLCVCRLITLPLSSEYGTCRTVTARFWPFFSGDGYHESRRC